MAKKNVTIEEMKEVKSDMELEILEIFQDFEKKYNTFIRYINFDRKEVKSKGKDDYVEQSKGKLIDVTINMDIIDLI